MQTESRGHFLSLFSTLDRSFERVTAPSSSDTTSFILSKGRCGFGGRPQSHQKVWVKELICYLRIEGVGQVAKGLHLSESKLSLYMKCV